MKSRALQKDEKYFNISKNAEINITLSYIRVRHFITQRNHKTYKLIYETVYIEQNYFTFL